MKRTLLYPLLSLMVFSFQCTGQNTNKTSMTAATASLYDIDIQSLSGESIDLKAFSGRKILFVNVASECGFTPQYAELQHLHETHGNKVAIVGVPCNQFGGQEPGSAKEIASFCEKNYGVGFLITQKVDVKGEHQHPLYAWLTQRQLNGKMDSEVSWNFQKYLVDENGTLIAIFEPGTAPTDESIVSLF